MTWINRPIEPSVGAELISIITSIPEVTRTKDRVLWVEVMIGLSVDKELTAVCIRSGISHRNRANIVAIFSRQSHRQMNNLGPPRAPPSNHRIIFGQRIASLIHKTFYNSVKFGPVIKAGLRELYKVRRCIRRID